MDFSDDIIKISKERAASLRLSGVSFQAADKVLVGDDIVVSYSVTNDGQYTTRTQSWIDAVYIYPEKLESLSEILQKGFFIKQVDGMFAQPSKLSITLNNPLGE